MTRPNFDRKYLKVAAVLLVGIAIIRLAYLLIYASPLTTVNSEARGQRVAAKFTAKIQGAEGDKVRLHFPEVPLNLETDYNDGNLELSVDLKMPKKPTQLRCQVLRDGRVVAQSQLIKLQERDIQELGTIGVKALK